MWGWPSWKLIARVTQVASGRKYLRTGHWKARFQQDVLSGSFTHTSRPFDRQDVIHRSDCYIVYVNT